MILLVSSISAQDERGLYGAIHIGVGKAVKSFTPVGGFIFGFEHAESGIMLEADFQGIPGMIIFRAGESVNLWANYEQRVSIQPMIGATGDGANIEGLIRVQYNYKNWAKHIFFEARYTSTYDKNPDKLFSTSFGMVSLNVGFKAYFGE